MQCKIIKKNWWVDINKSNRTDTVVRREASSRDNAGAVDRARAAHSV